MHRKTCLKKVKVYARRLGHISCTTNCPAWIYSGESLNEYFSQHNINADNSLNDSDEYRVCKLFHEKITRDRASFAADAMVSVAADVDVAESNVLDVVDGNASLESEEGGGEFVDSTNEGVDTIGDIDGEENDSVDGGQDDAVMNAEVNLDDSSDTMVQDASDAQNGAVDPDVFHENNTANAGVAIAGDVIVGENNNNVMVSSGMDNADNVVVRPLVTRLTFDHDDNDNDYDGDDANDDNEMNANTVSEIPFVAAGVDVSDGSSKDNPPNDEYNSDMRNSTTFRYVTGTSM